MPMPAATDLRAFIPARDFALSKAFHAALGWDVRDVGAGIALVAVGVAQHFYIRDYSLREVAENSMLHLTVDDAQACYAHVQSVLAEGHFPGARVQPPAARPCGAMVTFVHDPSGVLLQFCEWGSPHRAAP